MIIESHNAGAVIQLCGFGSVAMLDYLERSGVFLPSRKRSKQRGRRRNYTFRDVLVLKMIKVLLDNGTSVAALKVGLEKFQKIKWKADEAVLENELGALKYLLSSGGNIYFAKDAESLVDLTKNGQMAFSFVIDLEKIHCELCSGWRQGHLKLAM